MSTDSPGPGAPRGGPQERAAGIVATDLWLTRGERPVLRGATLEVPQGCVTALLAPSGAGKSTVLRCLTRLLDPDRGAITLAGMDIREIPPRVLRRRVGLVAQRPTMLPGTAAANVAYALGGAPSPDDPRVGRALEAAGLHAAVGARPAGELSGGEQARVAIARALACDPEILLLDEPTAALDQETAELVGQTLRALAGRGIGVCVAIHDLRFAQRFADRCVHLDGSDADEAPPLHPAGAGTHSASGDGDAA